MDALTRTLQVVAIAPAAVASTVMWFAIAALLPTGSGALLLVTGPGVLAVLWWHRPAGAERTDSSSDARGGAILDVLVDRLVALVSWARKPTAEETAVLRPVLWRLRELGVDRTGLLISRSSRASALVRPFGRDYVVVAPAVVEGVLRQRLAVDDVVALVAHSVGWLRSQHTRGGEAIAVWTLPWRVVRALASRVAAVAQWLPLVGFAWRIRVGVGVVAMVQSAVEGRTVLAVLIASLFTASYLTPIARRARDARLQRAADSYVAARGLGPAFLRAVVRVGGSEPDPRRIIRLQSGCNDAVELRTRPARRLVPN